MDHRVGRIVFALVVGLVVFFASYRWVTDPGPRAERAAQEEAVRSARAALVEMIGDGELQIVDPLAPNRKAGKVYVYAEAPGWAVSGYYRRGEQDRWHPYLVTLDETLSLTHLKVQDPLLLERAAVDPRLEVSP